MEMLGGLSPWMIVTVASYITKLKKKKPLLEGQVTLDIRAKKRRACENRHNREVKRTAID
jgi:hypothetical protein